MKITEGGNHTYLGMDITLKEWNVINATHPDMKGQTGGYIKTEIGVLHGRSSKQTINTKSPTDFEWVGCSEYLPYAMWFLHFLKNMDIPWTQKQDNKSTMKLLRNGI